jgi:hypothetical protein
MHSLWKAIWRSLKNLKIELSYHPTMPLPGIKLKECTPGYDRATWIPMFIAAQLIIAKLWKHPTCSMTDEWMWYIYTREFYSAIKKNEIMMFAGKWMELENFMLSDARHAQKIKGSMFPLICGSYTYKLNAYIETYDHTCIYIYIYIVTERTKLY